MKRKLKVWQTYSELLFDSTLQSLMCQKLKYFPVVVEEVKLFRSRSRHPRLREMSLLKHCTFSKSTSCSHWALCGQRMTIGGEGRSSSTDACWVVGLLLCSITWWKQQDWNLYMEVQSRWLLRSLGWGVGEGGSCQGCWSCWPWGAPGWESAFLPSWASRPPGEQPAPPVTHPAPRSRAETGEEEEPGGRLKRRDG